MNATERRQYEMLLRLQDFSNTHRDLFGGSAVGQEAFANINAAINELTATDLLKMAAFASARADRKGAARKALIEVLGKVSSLARVLRARGQTLPPFAMPASKSDQSLLTAGRQFARDAAAFDADFNSHGVGPKAITDSTETFETATRDRGMKRADHTAAQTRIRDLIAAALLDVRRLDLIVDNELAGNNALRAVWKQVRRVLDARASRGGGTSSDTVSARTSPPTPSPASSPEAAAADEAEATATEVEAPTLATVIEMPLRRTA